MISDYMVAENRTNRKWKDVITSSNNYFALHLKEIWEYRDLLLIFVRRDILAIYRQTILGPLWFFIQPLLATLVYVIIFSKVGRFSTDGMPPMVFYLSGLVLWSYFSECLLRTAGFFRDQSPILTKVYFPRLIIPLSLVLTNLIKFLIQFILFGIVYFIIMYRNPDIKPNAYALLFPLLVFMMAMLGLGMGIIVSSLTTRYKDLSHLVTFGVQLMMFVSPVIFPYSSFKNTRYESLVLMNPVSGIIEAFRYGFLGSGGFSWNVLGYDFLCIVLLLVIGLVTFNSVEKNFSDTI